MKRRVKVVYQHDSMLCGIACLQMVCVATKVSMAKVILSVCRERKLFTQP